MLFERTSMLLSVSGGSTTRIVAFNAFSLFLSLEKRIVGYTVHKIRICIVYEVAFIACSKAARCAANAIDYFIQQRPL